jgi:hypothetical protein
MGYDSGIKPREPGLWLGLSIASTLLCCMPLGVVGVVYSAMAMDARDRGDVYRWQERVEKARVWTLWSIALGVVYVAVVAFIGLAAMRQR